MPKTFLTVPRCLAFAACSLVAAAPADPPPPGAADGDAFLRDYAETRGFMLGRPVNATPTPDGSAVVFLRARSAREPSQELYEFNVASGQTRRLLSPEEALKGVAEQLSPEEKSRRERQRISVGGFTAFSISRDSALVLLSLSGKLYVLDRAKGSVRELATGPGTVVDPKFSPDSRSVAYVRNQDVCVFHLATGKETAVTTGGTETVSHGLAEFVAQEEMNRFSGYWWSPDSRRIVYEESDASKVESWYVADPAQPGNEASRTFYPRPGLENVSVRLGVAYVDGSEETVWLDWDHVRYPYLGKVTWGEHGPLTLTVLSRDQTELALLKVDPTWGETNVLLTEHDDAWVHLPQDVPVWLSEEDGGGFLWLSEQNGWQNLQRYAVSGEPQETWSFTQGIYLERSRDYVRTLSGVAGGQAFGVYSPRHPAQTRVLSVGLRQRLDGHRWRSDFREEAGMEQGVPSEDGNILILQTQTLDKMPATTIWRTKDGTLLGELPSIAANPPFVPNVKLEEPDVDSKTCADIIVHPRDFDPAAKYRYPVIVDVYGGPEHQQVVASMRPYLLDQWIADHGFIVVTIDGRGTPGRGRDWERAVAGHFGSVPLDDQVEALKALGAKHPEMDMERVGITGWSFGGYMSALAVLRRPDIFKAAVAGAPVSEWMDYDTCYTERYLGVPGAGRWPDAYKEGSLLTYAADLRRPLLIIHGTADDNVYLRHTLELMNAFFRAGKSAEFLPLSSFTHMVPDPVVRTRLEERIVGYFREHLNNP